MDIERVALITFRLVGVAGIIMMAVTGMQPGGKKLHVVYRLMILFIFLVLIAAYLIVRYAK